MNRKEFLQSAALGTVVGGLFAGNAKSQEPISAKVSEPLRFTSSPVLTNASDDGVTLLIGVSGPSAVAVHFGEGATLDRVAYGEVGGLRSYDDCVHKVRLTGLKPATRYSYRVEVQSMAFHNAYKIERGEKISTGVLEFKTLHSAGDDCRFVIWNDTHDRADTLAAVHAATTTFKPDFLL